MEMIAAYNALGQAVFRALTRSARNVVISPLSIGVTLALGYVGAAGETAQQMARALELDGALPDFCRANADLLRRYGEGAPLEALRLRLANALLLARHGDAVAKSYRHLLAESFAAEILEGGAARV